jgi:PTH1 family peptidyl-tRNA hydrolase
MNVSGEAVAYLVRRFRIPLDRLLVVYDDMDLPMGALRLRPQGGPGGHNGVRSIIAALDSEEFSRLRIGIGRPPPFVDPVAHVLGALTRTEEDALAEVWPRVTAAAESVVVDGLERAMNRHNTAPGPGAVGQDGDGADPLPRGAPPA